MKILLLGPQGCGKGTYAKMFEKEGFKHISMGDLLRKTIQEKNQISLEIKEYVDNGEMVPDKIVVDLIKKEITEENIVFDGFPRNLQQAKIIDKTFSFDIVFNIFISDEEAVRRLSGREQCSKCGKIYGLDIMPKKKGICDKCNLKLFKREDDKEEVIRKRLKIYYEESEPLINYYKEKGILKIINGEQKPEKVFKILESYLNKK